MKPNMESAGKSSLFPKRHPVAAESKETEWFEKYSKNLWQLIMADGIDRRSWTYGRKGICETNEAVAMHC